MLQARLNSRHQHVDALERAYALDPVASNAQSSEVRLQEHKDAQTAPAAALQPPSLAAYQLSRGRAEALARAAVIEQKHGSHISSRWTSNCKEYQQAALQCKCFHVQQLQGKIVADVDWLHWSKAVVSRTTHQHRGTASDILKRIRQKHIQMRDTVRQLKEWHAVPGDIGCFPYIASDLEVEAMQQVNYQIPWLQPQAAAPAEETKRIDLEQRITRCNEEAGIVCRETKDPVDFYQHRSGALQAAIHARRTGPTPGFCTDQCLLQSATEAAARSTGGQGPDAYLVAEVAQMSAVAKQSRGPGVKLGHGCCC